MMQDKIKTRDDLTSECAQLRKTGKTVGFTSGAFDLIHAGHVDYLEKAKSLCDVLIVGVNSDASVRSYKGEGRPLIPQDQRIKVVAALDSVDFTFLFDERRNRKNIETLKPDFYIKAADYAADQLMSRESVESYGGEIKLIPIEEKVSTTSILKKAADLAGASNERWFEENNAEYMQRRPVKSSPAVFLDRDGTLNQEIQYLHEPEKLELLPGVIEGLVRFQNMGYRLIIVTNQPGIGFGYYQKEDFYKVNLALLSRLSPHGIHIDRIYFCPHTEAEGCECRKPGQALIRRAADELNVDLKHSIFIGDRISDIETGRRAGMSTILIGEGIDPEYPGVKPDAVAADLNKAAEIALKLERI